MNHVGYITRAVYQGTCCRCRRVTQFTSGIDRVIVADGGDGTLATAHCPCGRRIYVRAVQAQGAGK